MNEITIDDIEVMVNAMADTAIENEKYFCDLDAAAGDGDFGVSLASGFKVIKKDWEQLDRSSISKFLMKISTIIIGNVGGCSGPVWGTGFMRAGSLSKDKKTLTIEDTVTILRSAIEGIMARGGATPGDKTLLDALIPIADKLEEYSGKEADAQKIRQDIAAVAEQAIEETRDWVAKRGRQSFTGDRSRGTLDPGIVAISMMMNNINKAFAAS